MSNLPDRLALIMNPANQTVTGIDFIFVDPATQTFLDIHFLQPPSALVPALSTTLTSKDDIKIYCPAENNATLPVIGLIWITPDVLKIQVSAPGDFALYRLQINNTEIDPYYNDVVFNFKAGCPSILDCRPGPEDCPEDQIVDFPIDYLARDFWSYRRALLEFATLRYPDWPDRLEADAGVMLVELMSAAGDEMAYHQDRIGREAYLETASQRRSLRRLARLVDYNIHDGLGASAWINMIVNPALKGPVPAGTNIWALGDSGQRIDFETGHGIAEEFSVIPTSYNVDSARNHFDPHIWDKDQICLPVGATELYLEGDQVAVLLPFDDIPADGSAAGKWVSLETYPTNPAQQPRTQIVRIIQVTKEHDPVLNVDTTHIVWEPAQAIAFEMDMTILKLHGNLVPATSGKTQTTYFITGGKFSGLSTGMQQNFLAFAGLPATTVIANTLEREGRDGTTAFRFTLPGSDQQSMVWLGEDPFNGSPEILLRKMIFDSTTSTWSADNINHWTWRRSLVGGEYSSLPESRDYTFDDGNWTRVVGYLDDTKTHVHRDYAAGTGLSILFGDGEFGLVPPPLTVFRVDYRLGGGGISNVAARAIRHIGYVSPPIPQPLSLIKKVKNPLAAINGLDPQSPDEIRQLAPEAFQAVTYRAVIPADYEEAAERLPWVQKAGCSFRWTGSWISAFVTADPLQQVGMTVIEENNLLDQENRFRQAGREVIIKEPIYANLDIELEVCAMENAYAGEVEKRVMEALFGKKGYPAIPGYFSPDRFTFGTALERSTLEATIQEVPGVLAVEWIRFRRRGWFDWKFFTDYRYDPGQNSIICVANDPLHPEEGILQLNIHAGL